MPGSTPSTTTASSAASSAASTSAAATTTTAATTTAASAAAATTTTTPATTPAATPTPSAASAATATAPSSSTRALAPLAPARATSTSSAAASSTAATPAPTATATVACATAASASTSTAATYTSTPATTPTPTPTPSTASTATFTAPASPSSALAPLALAGATGGAAQCAEWQDDDSARHEGVRHHGLPPKGLFPPEPEKYTGLKLKVAILGPGLAGMSTAAELLDQGHKNFTCHARACAGCAGGMHVHGGCAFVGGVRGACAGSERGCEQVDIYEARPLLGGKVASFQDKDGNHIEMGLHVFFDCYNNLFRLMANASAPSSASWPRQAQPVLPHGQGKPTLFRFVAQTLLTIGKRTKIIYRAGLPPVDKAFNALALATSPVVRALVDPEGAFQVIRDLDKARPAPPLPLPRHPPPPLRHPPPPPSLHLHTPPHHSPPHLGYASPCSLTLLRKPCLFAFLSTVSFSEWFTSHGGTRESIKRMWDPVAYALGFIDCDNISVRCMLTIFAFFATKTEVSMLRMLYGSHDRFLADPIAKYITDCRGRFHVRQLCQEVLYSTAADGSTVVTGLHMKQTGGKGHIVTADAYVAALDVPGAKRLVPKEWRERWGQFRDIYELVGVPVITVQLRYDGWVTEMNDIELSRQLALAAGLDNLLYSPDADFSCFADLALTSPNDYYKEGQGSLMQGLTLLWHSVVKINQSLYREAPDLDQFHPDQKSPVPNFFLADSYTKQDYLDSMEGVTVSGRKAVARICEAGEAISALAS
ncbi:unnamed protein product [Closterium sp. NIES-64]|nr:unnamed protein product [Closterium sp. NIES-64]